MKRLVIFSLILLSCAWIIDASVNFTSPKGGNGSTSFPESGAGKSVYNVSVIATAQATVTYTLETQEPDSTPKKFTVAGSGEVKTSEAIDYETIKPKSFVLTIKAASNTESATATLTIAIKDVDSTPAFNSTHFCGTVLSNATKDTTVGNYMATSADSTAGTISYDIVSGDDDPKKFKINAGVIKTTEQKFNKTAKAVYSMVITASVGAGNGTKTGTATVTVVLDGDGTCTSSTANNKKSNKSSASVVTASLTSGIFIVLYHMILSV